ncbi:MAG: Gldg family protein [Acidimicrobiia bacterium]
MLFVLRREVRAFLQSPQTYAIGAAYLILSGVFFVNILISSEIPDLEQYYSNIANTLLVLVPVVAMRSFAEERRTGALDVTLSWPGSRTGLVLGKFVANTLYLWLLSSIVWQYFRLVGDVADIGGGRTAGGFVGLLLMAMAFSALALMVSARASSPAAAAFLGFGLLLFLWILEYAPGWIGDWLRALGPTEHFAPFPTGIVYWEDVAYFVVVTLVGLGLAVSALDRDRPGRAVRSLMTRGAALAAVIVVGGATVALAGDVEGFVDLTSGKVNTTTQTTRDTIERLEGRDIRLTGFAEPISKETEELQALTKQYRAAGADISLEIIDPDVQPGRAREAGLSGYGQVIVKLGDRQELLRAPTQLALTSTLLRLSRPARPIVCMTAGHGERDIGDRTEVGLTSLAGALRELGFSVQRLALAAAGAPEKLQTCAVVVVAGPRVAFLPAELELLAAYTDDEGRLLILADPAAKEPIGQLNELLDPWGVRLGTSVVRDASALANDPSSIVSLDYPAGGNPVVNRLIQDEIPVVLTNVVPIAGSPQAEEAGAYSVLVQSSPKSWISGPDGGVEEEGPFALAAMSDWQRIEGSTGENAEVVRTRIGVVGGVDVFTNRILDIFGNRQFATGLVQWVALEDDVIAAGRPLGGFTKVVLTTSQKDRLIRQGIVFPTLALLIPLPFAALRLRRG